MLFMHETHRVIGEREEEFEQAYRDGWMKMLAETDYARLLWYFTHAHGSGASYNVITVTAIRDGEAWEELARRIQKGDLRDWAGEVDGLRHDVTSKLCQPFYWSPMREVELSEIPTDGVSHEPTMYMQDTMWPKLGKFMEYVDAAGGAYQKMLDTDEAVVQIRIQAAFQAALGAGARPEVTLMQKIFDHDQLLWLLTNDLPESTTGPGTWMHTALTYRDQWVSKLLRTAKWSPLD